MDDTTLYACEKKLHNMQIKSESESLILIKWFHENYFKASSGKSHVMLTTDIKLKINVEGSPIGKEKIVQLLRVTLDNELSFQPHLNLLCKKISQKLRGFIKAPVMSNFSYCSLAWMWYSWTLNNKINKLHESASLLVYDDRQSAFGELLNIDQSVNIHHRNLQVLATEFYQVHHGLAPELMNDILKKKRNVKYSFRKILSFETRNIKFVYYGSEATSFLGPKNCELLLGNIKDSEILNIFKSDIKFWKPENCPCCLRGHRIY